MLLGDLAAARLTQLEIEGASRALSESVMANYTMFWYLQYQHTSHAAVNLHVTNMSFVAHYAC